MTEPQKRLVNIIIAQLNRDDNYLKTERDPIVLKSENFTVRCADRVEIKKSGNSFYLNAGIIRFRLWRAMKRYVGRMEQKRKDAIDESLNNEIMNLLNQ